jgi:cell shape-determining protein MreC
MVLDKGALNGVVQGSPVMDEKGILGQITRVLHLQTPKRVPSLLIRH